jgi:hypothetical protein
LAAKGVCHVIIWAYNDKSGHGVVGVYAEKSTAQLVFDALEGFGDPWRNFELVERDLILLKALLGDE